MAKHKNKKLIENSVIAKNKNAYHYNIIKTYLAGLSLRGSEVKSLISNGADINPAFVTTKKNNLVLINAHISAWKQASHENHDPNRARQLLLNKSEIKQIRGYISERGLTCIPLKIIRKHGKFKLEIGVGKRMKLHDKRERIKKKEMEREKQKQIKGIF